jgi:hypothetical protein
MNLNFPLADIVTGLFIVAVVYVLVRPQSKAADMIRLFSDAVATLVKTATDL